MGLKNLGNLGDKDGVGLGLAYTTTTIIADEAKASDAGRAHLPVAARSVCYPF